MLWEIPRIWEGGTCIIIGGGASVPRQFDVPENIIQDVYAGRIGVEAYSPYLASIHNLHIIAVNMAYRLGSWVDCVFFGDNDFLKNQQIEFFAFKGMRITSAPSFLKDDYGNRLRVIERDEKKKLGICFEPNKVAWNLNSGAAAINLAYHFGVKRIILLGFDMKLDGANNQHWHKFYSGALTTIGGVMASHLRSFPVIAKDLEGIVDIVNCNPDSAIESFPKMNFKDIRL